jgi:hypothetical protein
MPRTTFQALRPCLVPLLPTGPVGVRGSSGPSQPWLRRRLVPVGVRGGGRTWRGARQGGLLRYARVMGAHQASVLARSKPPGSRLSSRSADQSFRVTVPTTHRRDLYLHLHLRRAGRRRRGSCRASRRTQGGKGGGARRGPSTAVHRRGVHDGKKTSDSGGR